MLNDLFKKYQNLSFKEIDIDHHHKKQLQKRLFKEEKIKKPFWNWTKAIFTAPVVAAFAIIFLLSSNQETVKHVLQPQEALAQALENTFNLDDFEKTFGLPDDGQFYHRIMTYQSNETDNPNGPFTETTQLWTDGTKIRRDTLILSDDSKFRDFFSFLIDPVEDKNCSFVVFKECRTLSKFDQDFINLFKQGKATYKPVSQENLISDLSVEPFYDGPKGPIYLIQWSTKTPMEDAEILSGYDYNFALGGNIDDPYTVSNPDANHYVNVLKDDKYWHKTEINMNMNFVANKEYFQITNHSSHSLEKLKLGKEPWDETDEENSMIYIIDRKGNLAPITPEQFIEEIKKSNASTDASKDMFYIAFQSAIVFLKKDTFSDPIFIKPIEKNGQSLIQIRYFLPEAYNRMMGFEGSNDEYVADFFLDETQTHFLGYNMIKNGVETESIWIQDEILPDTQKFPIFDQTTWEKNIANEFEAKAKEREEWFESEKKQAESGLVELKLLN